MEDNGTLTTSSAIAPQTQRRYLLEIPPEVRLLIYDFYFWDKVDGPTEAAKGDYIKAMSYATKAMAMDMVRFKTRLNLPRTCREIMREALPEYQILISLRIERSRSALARLAQAERTSEARPIELIWPDVRLKIFEVRQKGCGVAEDREGDCVEGQYASLAPQVPSSKLTYSSR